MKHLSLVALLAISVAAGSRTHATPQYDMVTTYFSDATLTTVVGRKFEMCSGTSRTGTTSAYYDIFIGQNCSDGSANAMSESGPGYTGVCDDGEDNDGDGWIDSADLGCQSW